jgi:hypothetical protein
MINPSIINQKTTWRQHDLEASSAWSQQLSATAGANLRPTLQGYLKVQN